MLGLALAVFAGFIGCGGSGGGGGGETPTITSIKDARGEEIADGETGVFPTSFTITFDAEMDIDTITAEGSVLIECGDMGEPALVPTLDGTKKILTATMDDAYKYQLIECKVTFTNKIKSLDGKAIAETEYTFTNACAVSDDFNAVTGFDTPAGSCWKIENIEGLIESSFPTWNELLDSDEGWASFDAANSSFNTSTENIAAPAEALQEIITKTAEVNSDDNLMGFEFKLSNIQGFCDGDDGGAGVMLIVGENIFAAYVRLQLGVRKCMFYAVTDGEHETSIDCTDQEEVRFVVSMDTDKKTWESHKVVLQDGTSTNFNMTGIAVPDIGSEDDIKAGIYLQQRTGTNNADFDYIIFDGLTVDGQY